MDDQLWNTKITASEIKDLPETDGAWIAKSPAGFAVVSDYGSARYNTAAGLCAMVYAKETNDLTFAEWAKDQMEYILGDNPMGYSFEVGYENSYATHPHHRSSSCSSKSPAASISPRKKSACPMLSWNSLSPAAFRQEITMEIISASASTDGSPKSSAPSCVHSFSRP